MRRHRPHDSDVQILNLGEVNMQTLISQSSGGQHSGQGSTATDFFLQIRENENQTRKGDLSVADCYVHFRPAPQSDMIVGLGFLQGLSGLTIDVPQKKNAFDIQYWFFYPYNGDIVPGAVKGGEHEGDWEHITVRTSRGFQNIMEVFYSRHDFEGVWLQPGEFSVNSEGRPIVFSAINSHASYATPGRQERPVPLPDRTQDGGPRWETWKNIKAVGEINNPIGGQFWIRYTGRWGEIGPFSSGPFGPAFQGKWEADLL